MAATPADVDAMLKRHRGMASDWFLLGGLPAFLNLRGEVIAQVIEDNDLFAAVAAHLRGIGAPEYTDVHDVPGFRGS